MIHIFTLHLNCFHGTINSAFELIKKQQLFSYEHRDDHWLGNGVYFFINDIEKAQWWAKNAHMKAKRLSEKRDNIDPCTLFVSASIDTSKILNLDTEKGQKELNDFINILKRQNTSIISKNSNAHADRCALLDLLVKYREYDASCYHFPDNSSSYGFKDLEKYGIMNNKGYQLCVYNQGIIDFTTLKSV